MKICLMSGAYVNAGDFLIEKRTTELLKANFQGAQIDIWKKNQLYDDQIDKLNEYDLICFGGGPGYQKKMYPKTMKFISDLSKLTTPYIILGWGWKGQNTSIETIYKKYLFSDEMNLFLKRATGKLGARDWYTARMLQNMGYEVEMTGCPAWYDLMYLDNMEIQKLPEVDMVLRVCVSDAAFSINYRYLEKLLRWVKKYFRNSEVILVNHKPVMSGFDTIKNCCDKLNIEILEISNSCDGFSIYDACDLHIGFRVHAHIYNLSHRKISILLNEDARGAGVNQALGLEDIFLPTANFKCFLPFFSYREDEVIKQVESVIDRVYLTNGLEYMQAVERMRQYYEQMKEFLQESVNWR